MVEQEREQVQKQVAEDEQEREQVQKQVAEDEQEREVERVE